MDLATRRAEVSAFRRYEAGERVDPEAYSAKVACEGCTACCRQPIRLLPQESGMGLDFETVNGMRKLRLVDGHCVHLVGNACSVYERRPAMCRVFDCRDLAVAGLTQTGSAALDAAVKRWDLPASARIASTARMLMAKGYHPIRAIWKAM